MRYLMACDEQGNNAEPVGGTIANSLLIDDDLEYTIREVSGGRVTEISGPFGVLDVYSVSVITDDGPTTDYRRVGETKLGRPRLGANPRHRINTTIDESTRAAIKGDRRGTESDGQILDRWARERKT